MIPREMFKIIMEKLLARSRQDKVRWVADGSAFGVSLPESSLTLDFHSPETEHDYFDMALWNKEGKQAQAEIILSGDPLWVLAHDLYYDASRCVNGWDKVLADVVKALDSGERIGWEVPQSVRNIGGGSRF